MFASAPNEPPPRQLPIDVLEREWRRELAGPRLSSRFRTWGEREPALARFPDPAAPMRFLRSRVGGTAKDEVLLALLACARIDSLAAQMVLEAIRPGLEQVAGRIMHDASEREEIWSLLLAQAWERIRRYPLRRRHRVAANLLLDCQKYALKALAKARERGARESEELAYDMAAPPAIGTDVVTLLHDAVRARAISAEEERLIVETRLYEWPLGDVARSFGVSRHTLVVRRLRAEKRLFTYLGFEPVTHRGQKGPSLSARVTGGGPSPLTGERTTQTTIPHEWR